MQRGRGRGVRSSDQPHRKMADPDELQLRVPNVSRTGRQLGYGSYGSVEELVVDGVVCAGKRLHDVLARASNVGVRELRRKYVTECQLLSHLHHPHIVQFLGLYYPPDAHLPILVMEKLHTSLDSILEGGAAAIGAGGGTPLGLKQSILTDIVSGLVYLHHHNPPVIHRDLTAKNVLLNLAMVAKISDLGNARILRPEELANWLTQAPGTAVYMPPEALYTLASGGRSLYGPSIDVFSFGHLLLYTVIEEFPSQLRAAAEPDPQNPGQLIALTEVERRVKYVQMFHQQLGVNHPLVHLMKRCLRNDPSKRPSADKVLDELKRLRETARELRDPYEGWSKLDMIKEMSRLRQQVRLATPTSGGEDVEALRSRVQQLQDRISRKEREQADLLVQHRRQLHDLQATNRQQEADLQYVQRQMQELRTTTQRQEAEKQQRLTDMRNLQYNLRELEATNRRLEAEKQQLDADVRQLQYNQQRQRTQRDQHYHQLRETCVSQEEEIRRWRDRARSLEKELDVMKRESQWNGRPQRAPVAANRRLDIPPPAPTALSNPAMPKEPMRTAVHEDLTTDVAGYAVQLGPPLRDLPVGIFDAQVAVLNNKLYVGGGDLKKGEPNWHLYICDLAVKVWSRLANECKAEHSAMTVYRSQLLLIGGLLPTGIVSDQVWSLQDGGGFRQLDQHMKNPRVAPCAVSSERYLVVAAGIQKTSMAVTVEIYDGQQWCETAPLPDGCSFVKATLSRGVIYLTGGRSQGKDIYYASLESLRHLPVADKDLWKKLPELPYPLCSCTVFKDALIAIGGKDSGTDSGATARSSPVNVYNPQTKTWAGVGQLPQSIDSTCTIALPSGGLVVVGGRITNARASTAVYTLF